MKDNNRPRGTLAYPLDHAAMTHAIVHAKHDLPNDCNATNCQELIEDVFPMKSALVYGPEKQWAVVSFEGVGNHADDYDVKSTVFYFQDAQGTMHDVPLGFNAVDKAVIGPAVDLADFIRVFGDHMDINHHKWHLWASGKLVTS